MKKILITSFMIFGVVCLSVIYGRQSGKTDRTLSETSLSRTYSNDYFSIQYPYSYLADASFNCKPASMEELRDMEADSITAMPMNELNIVPHGPNHNWDMPEVYVVLSRHKLDFPIRMFMDLSIYSKNQENSNNMPYIGCSDVDSISFAGFPALAIDFAYKGEQGDTLIQHQIIVQKPNYELYYINSKYNLSNVQAYELGNKIIDTFKFK